MIVVMLRFNYLRYLKFALVGGTNFLLELGIFNFIVIALHWNSEWGKIIGATVTTILAYFVVHLFDNAGWNQTLRLNFMNCVTIVAISVARYLSYKHWVFPHAK